MMTESNYLREIPPYGIYLEPISGKFYIQNKKIGAVFKDSYSTLQSAEEAARKEVKDNFVPTELIHRGYKFQKEEIKLVTVYDYRKNTSVFGNIEVFTKPTPNSHWGDWDPIRQYYEPTTENLAIVNHIHVLEKQIDMLRSMITEAKQGLSNHITLERLMEITTRKGEDSCGKVQSENTLS